MGRVFRRTTPIVVVAFLMLACSRAASTSTAVPTLTNTFTPPPIFTPLPTLMQLPTATSRPGTPTAAPMGVPVMNGAYEVSVVSTRSLATVYIDQFYQWIPTEGRMFVELGIRAANRKPGAGVSIPWRYIYIIEENGDAWYPTWGEFKPVASDIEISPKSLGFRSLENPDEEVRFDDAAYIRAIYSVDKRRPTILLFGFGDSPLIEVIVR